MIKYLLCLVLAVFAAASMADTSVVLGGLSNHVGQDTYTYEGKTKSYNEVNLALGFEQDDVRWVLYNNSYKKLSTVVMWVPKMELGEHFSIGPRLGITTGYEDTPERLLVAPILGVELDIQNEGVHLVPAFQAPNVFTLHLQLDY